MKKAVLGILLILVGSMTWGAGSSLFCLKMYDIFCKRLWSDGQLGNTDVTLSSGKVFSIRYGFERPGLSYATFNFLKAVLLGRSQIPQDLERELTRNNYFGLLESFLSQPVKANFLMSEEESTHDSVDRLNTLFKEAMKNATRARFKEKNPQYLEFHELSPDQQKGELHLSKEIAAEFFVGVWKNSAVWNDVEEQFNLVKTEYMQWLTERLDLNPLLRTLALLRLGSIQLRIPGSNPEYEEGSCATDEASAYYDPGHHEFTVCAGLFGGSIVTVVAHEMAHSIDPTTLKSYFLSQRPVFSGFKKAYNNLCENTKLSCEEFAKLKRNLLEISPVVPEFYPTKYLECLGQKELVDFPRGSEVSDLASNYTNIFTDQYTRAYFFSSVVLPEVETLSGRHFKNSGYLNPCVAMQDNHEKHQFQLYEVLLVAFEAEYRCSSLPETTEKFEASLTSARHLLTIAQENIFESMQKDADVPELILRNQARTVGEQTADNIGLTITARILNKFPNVIDRRKTFLAAGSLLCDSPGIVRMASDLAVAEKKYNSEEHSLNKVRHRELMIDPIKESLQCEDDDHIQSCSL